MTLVDKQELESIAAAFVVEELGGLAAERRDRPGAPSGTRDFDVLFEDGHEEPLEVTSNFDAATMRALGRTDGGVLHLDANVKRLWLVMASRTYADATGTVVPFDRNRITELIPPLIEQLEHAGEISLDVVQLAWPIAYGATVNHREVALELHQLGITIGNSIEIPPDEEAKPGVTVALGGGGSWGPDTIPTVLEEIAALPDNVAKLDARRDAERRHLYVILAGRGSTDMAGWPLQQFLDGDWIWERDPRLPRLPDAITTIWAGNRSGGIYATPPSGWQRFGAGQAQPLAESAGP